MVKLLYHLYFSDKICKNQISHFSTKTYDISSQKSRFNEMVLLHKLSTHQLISRKTIMIHALPIPFYINKEKYKTTCDFNNVAF